MKKFEYKTYFFNLGNSAKSDSELSKLGNEGWEVITVFPLQLNRELQVLVYPMRREVKE